MANFVNCFNASGAFGAPGGSFNIYLMHWGLHKNGRNSADKIFKSIFFDSLWPSDAIWRHRSGSTMAQVMACYLMSPSHYLNQSWLIVSKVEWYSSKDQFTRDTSAISHWNYLENCTNDIKLPFVDQSHWKMYTSPGPLFACWNIFKLKHIHVFKFHISACYVRF